MNAVTTVPERAYLLEALGRYWPRAARYVHALPMPQVDTTQRDAFPPGGAEVVLPRWAADVGVVGVLWVPAYTIVPGEEPAWERTDWVEAAFWYLSGAAERAYEGVYGPVHSYSCRLKGWDPRFWQRAWVNRIALFLRRWTARANGREEDELFGPLPVPEVVLTHDVDAVEKTIAIRCKQTAFCMFNAARQLNKGRFTASVRRFSQGVRFLVTSGDYWRFEELMALENHHGLRSQFNVYGGPGGSGRTMRQRLFDPAYSVEDSRVRGVLRRLHAGGWTIGLHQSFDAWGSVERMTEERTRVESAVGAPVTSCRQHWLRFSWRDTWKAQARAGLELDTTLGFNDRPGFRMGCAMRFRPWDPECRRPITIDALPMILMDSHLYDYGDLTEAAQQEQTRYWIDEVRAVRGVATVVWHQRVIDSDYGWGAGFRALLEMLTEV